MQNDYYGPISRAKYEGLVDDTVQPLLQQFEENYQQFPLSAASRNIGQEDVDFFSYIMQVDLRQRPAAREALKHSWFDRL